MSIAEREPSGASPRVLATEPFADSADALLHGYGRIDHTEISRQSLGTLRVAMDVFLAVVLLTALQVVTSSSQAAVAVGALWLASAGLGRARSASLGVGARILDELPGIAQVAAVATVLVHLGVGAAGGDHLTLGLLGATWLAVAGACTASQLAGGALGRRHVRPERCLLVGPESRCEGFSRSLAAESLSSLKIVGRIASEDLGPSCAGLQPIEDLLLHHQADRVVILCGANPAGSAQAARRARNAGARVSLVPEAIESIGMPGHIEHLGSSVLLTVAPAPTMAGAMQGKRTLDVAGACAAFLVLGPLMLAIAVAIKLTSKGPVLFWQDRIGLDGKRFRIAKFRSMVADAEELKAALREHNEAGGGLFKMVEDPRVTSIGRLIRRTSLDELPQLLNVLRGDMSLVGPRPLVCDEDVLIDGWFRDRLRLKPGMTGRWQVMGSARIPMNEMVALDQQYVATWTLWLDIRILLRTVAFVVRRQGM